MSGRWGKWSLFNVVFSWYPGSRTCQKPLKVILRAFRFGRIRLDGDKQWVECCSALCQASRERERERWWGRGEHGIPDSVYLSLNISERWLSVSLGTRAAGEIIDKQQSRGKSSSDKRSRQESRLETAKIKYAETSRRDQQIQVSFNRREGRWLSV